MLFITAEEIPIFKSKHFHIRESMQYYFFNENLGTFSDYLDLMKPKKAKQIRRERVFPYLTIERFTGEHLTDTHARKMYQFYLSTIDQKSAIDYLKEKFFIQIFCEMKDQVLYVEASQHGKAIAGSLFFYGQERLYGRYWERGEPPL